jgi:hypothetical protein
MGKKKPTEYCYICESEGYVNEGRKYQYIHSEKFICRDCINLFHTEEKLKNAVRKAAIRYDLEVERHSYGWD